MKQVFLSVLLMLVPAMATADAVEINGINYNLINNHKLAEVTYNNTNKYSGDIVINETVEYGGEIYKVTSIGESAFASCSDVTSVAIPNSVTSIGSNAFRYCFNIKSVTIPPSVKSIGQDAFWQCYATSVHISDLEKWCKISFSSGGNPLGYANHLFLNGEEVKDLVIPSSLTTIGDFVFSGCKGLTSVTIHNGITSIGQYAFCNCSGLTSIVIPNSVTSIGMAAFANCVGLTSLTISNSVTEIKRSVFGGCSGLTSIIIPNNVNSIGVNAFQSCSGLTSLTIGSGVSLISEYAINTCKELTDIYCYAEDPPTVKTDAFNGSFVDYIKLHVPSSSIEKYKSHEQWSKFMEIVELTDENTKKCSKPTISVVDGEIVFGCETEGVEYVAEVTAPDAKKYYDGKIYLSGKYKITVYATKEGYGNSEIATAEITASGGKYGDLNNDGVINAADVVKIVDIIMDKE